VWSDSTCCRVTLGLGCCDHKFELSFIYHSAYLHAEGMNHPTWWYKEQPPRHCVTQITAELFCRSTATHCTWWCYHFLACNEARAFAL